MTLPFAQDSAPTAVAPATPKPRTRSIALVCAKGGLDECYPVLIMANAARMSGIECHIFFTFWGLDVITESRVDHLHVNLVGNPSSPVPTVVVGLPGVERAAGMMMSREMERLELPGPREMVKILSDSGCNLYGCELAMRMFRRTKEDLLPEVEAVITATDFFELTTGSDIIFV
jgi:peroxiredoxin family protein